MILWIRYPPYFHVQQDAERQFLECPENNAEPFDYDPIGPIFGFEHLGYPANLQVYIPHDVHNVSLLNNDIRPF